jgi:hypothetical protein
LDEAVDADGTVRMTRDRDQLDAGAWTCAVDYLQLLAAEQFETATDILERAIEAEGIGAMCEALSDVCRSLMDRVVFDPGTIDIHTVVERIAHRIVDVAQDTRPDALDHQRSLIVFLGSEGLPCAARADVATWTPIERLRALVACTVGLLGVVSDDERVEIADAVTTITPPATPEPALGTFGLAWRGEDSGIAEPFAGVVPHGYTAHFTFIGSGQCSLRAIFARVAYLRDMRATGRSPRQIMGIPMPAGSPPSS